jgi:orotidine 5'-phosphate decarboxylase subfamily 2
MHILAHPGDARITIAGSFRLGYDTRRLIDHSSSKGTRPMTFTGKLQQAAHSNQSLLCVGLDPDPERIPTHLGSGAHAVVAFNKAIIRATQDIACAYKPNLGFYTLYGHDGIRALQETRRAIPDHIPVILDAKVGDIDTTSRAYAQGYFGEMGFDAVTAHPYLGVDGLEPLLTWENRCVFVLAKTSNPGSGDLQGTLGMLLATYLAKVALYDRLSRGPTARIRL